jgi:hypothetical protein
VRVILKCFQVLFGLHVTRGAQCMKLNRERKTTAGVADSLRYSLHRLIQNEAKSCLVRLRDINILSQVEFFFYLKFIQIHT